MKVVFFKGKVAKGASYVKLPIKNQVLINIENKDKLCGICSILAFFHAPRDNPNRVSDYTQNLH